MKNFNHKALRRSRTLYIAEAAIEYLIALLVQGSFLATLTKELGMSDSLTGIISSFISLGCLFQLVSLFIRRRHFKRFVIWGSIINQIMFMMLYVCPLTPISKGVKTAVFILMIFGAYFIYYVVHPKKINWFMSLVPDAERGKFTAHKEIISLIGGTFFSYSMGFVVDKFKAAGNIKGALVTAAIVICVLIISHTLTMLFSVEPAEKTHPVPNIKEGFLRIWKDKATRRVVLMFMIWNVAHYISMPYFAVYQIGDLGMSLTTVTLMVAMRSVVRIFASVPMGNFADKNGFGKMFRLCMCIMCLAWISAATATPKTALAAFGLYYVFSGIAMSGVNSCQINMIFDYVESERRADALAVSQALGGAAGFLATLSVSPLISYVQANGDSFLGLHLYGQQVTSVLALLFNLLTIAYLHFAILKK